MPHLKNGEIEKLWAYLHCAFKDKVARDKDLHEAFDDEPKVLFEELRYADEMDTEDRKYEEISSFGNQLDEIIHNATDHFKECRACFEEYHLHVKEYALAGTLAMVYTQRKVIGIDDPTSFTELYPKAIQEADFLHLLKDHIPKLEKPKPQFPI